MDELLAKIDAIHKDVKSIERRLKKLDKTDDDKKKTSGFLKPTKVSSSMAEFLGVPEDTETTRSAVAKEITKYVKSHDLADPNDKRTIRLDDTLKNLIHIDEGVSLTYLNLHRFIKHHFLK